MKSLQELCIEAWEAGQSIDLTGCTYGPSHTVAGFVHTEPYQYYYFLAGLCRVIKAKNILEIGTHYGGSILAMNRAVEAENIVTIDPTIQCELPSNIFRIKGKGEQSGTYSGLASRFSSGLDLVFVDGVHSYRNTKEYLKHSRRLSPRFIVFDDIRLNPEMVKFWAEISKKYESYDCTVESRREEDCGFGIIRLRN